MKKSAFIKLNSTSIVASILVAILLVLSFHEIDTKRSNTTNVLIQQIEKVLYNPSSLFEFYSIDDTGEKNIKEECDFNTARISELIQNRKKEIIKKLTYQSLRKISFQKKYIHYKTIHLNKKILVLIQKMQI